MRRISAKSILRRTTYSIIVLFFSISLTFYLVHNIPGDILYTMAYQIMDRMSVTFEEAKEIAKLMYLGIESNKPLHEQYFNYLLGLLQGNLGYSWIYKTSVNKIVVTALPWTLFVLSMSVLMGFGVGILFGLAAALKRESPIGSVMAAYASVSHALPDFILAIILIIIFAAYLRVLPPGGTYDAGLKPGFYPAFIVSVFKHAILPMLSYTVPRIGSWALLIKSNAASVLEEDFVKSAEARGLRGRRIMTAYIGRISLLPLLALLGVELGTMLGGSTLIENTFAYLGMGFYFSRAITRRDYGLMQGLFFVTIAGVILANLVLDIVYPYIDPRARQERGR